ncbi:hypothetical protein AAMO2058_001649100, partial [Amorphochlora amoebiformis]
MHGLPSLFTLDVPRGHQDSKVEANQHPPSPMSVVEPGSCTFLPSVNVPSQVGFISHIGVHGPLQNVYERHAIPITHSNRTNVPHVNPNMSNATNQNTSWLAPTNTGCIVVPFDYWVSGIPIVSAHVPNTTNRVNGGTNAIAAPHSSKLYIPHHINIADESDKMDPYESDHIMDVEGCDNNHSHGSPSLFDLDVSRGHQAPTRGPHMQVTVNQDSKVKANQHPPSPMSVVEPAQAGGFTFLPSVNVPSQVGSISHVGVHGLTSLESKREKIQPPKAKKQRRVRHESICKWCGSVCEKGLPRHVEKCADGLFEAACYAIRAMFGKENYKIKSADVKKAYCKVIESTEKKAELISRIKERMTNRTKSKITQLVRAPGGNRSGYKAFQGLDAMVCLFFRLFNLKMPFA